MISTETLQRAVVIAQLIESLQRELDSILGGGFSSSPAPAKRGRKPKEISFGAETVEAKPKRKKRKKLSTAALEAIREGQRRRWSKVHAAEGEKASPKAEKPEADQPAKKRKKRKMSPEALERIREAQKKRWAAFHKAQKAGK